MKSFRKEEKQIDGLFLDRYYGPTMLEEGAATEVSLFADTSLIDDSTVHIPRHAQPIWVANLSAEPSMRTKVLMLCSSRLGRLPLSF